MNYIGYENIVEFASWILSHEVFLGQHNDPQTGETICTAAWISEETNITHYYRCIARTRCYTAAEFVDQLAAAESPEAKQAVIKKGYSELLVKIQEVIEQVRVEPVKPETYLLDFTNGLLSLPGDLNPQPVLVNESVFEFYVNEAIQRKPGLVGLISKWSGEAER